MAKYGISGVIGGGSAEGGAVERHMLGFQAAYARRGIKLELGERLALGYQSHIASSREQAIREAPPHDEENMKCSAKCIEALKLLEKRYPGLDRVICATPLGTPLADLGRFAKEVIPAFRDTRNRRRSAVDSRSSRPSGRIKLLNAVTD